MKLLEFASAKYNVMLVYDLHDDCVVLNFIHGIDESLRNKILHLLEQHVPYHGPPSSKEKSRHLRGKIWEFKADQKKGPGLRVPYFRDGDKYICTHAFLKDQTKTPSGEIDRAEAVLDEYLEAKETDQITTVERG